MTSKNLASRFFLVCTVQLFLTAPTMVSALGNLQESYQEVSYDDLINELNSEHTSAVKMQNEKKVQPLRETRVGIGFVQSFTQLQVKNSNTDRMQSGLQIAASKNLDTPSLYAEGVFRNFSGSSLKNESLQVQQVDGRIGFRNDLEAPWKYTLLTGLSARLINATNSTEGYAVSELTPSFTAGFGAMAEIHKNIHLGFELSGRTALFGSNSEKNSADLTLRLDTTL